MPTNRIAVTSLIASFGTLVASPALAQNETSESSPGDSQRVEDARSILPRVGTDETPVMPTRAQKSEPKQPGLTQGQDWLKILHQTLETKVGASTLAEGSFVLARLGDLVEAPGGLLVFVPDRDTREQGEGAVLLMPTRVLEQLQSEWSGQRVLVSGEIFTYHDRNQLLISDYRLVREQLGDQPQTNDETPDQPEAKSQPIEDDPDVRDLLDELDRAQPKSLSTNKDPFGADIETLPRTPSRRPSATGTGPEEGTLLLRRPARMVRNAQGAWSLVFDNDEPGAQHAEGLVLMPCRALMRMERWAMEQGDAARFLISGRVYAYQDQAYLLPTLAQRMGPSDLNSIQ